ncbi:hypothetical protein BDV97DRAFT_276192, partial [Delphinella strobiligena]
LPIVQWTLIVSLIFVAGLAWCFILWVVPIIKLPTNTSRSAIAQFEETILRGFFYLRPSSIALAATLALTAYLTSRHPDPRGAEAWKMYALSCFVVVQVAWWEIVLIFPLNDAVIAMKEKLKGPKQDWLKKADQVELVRMIDLWTKRHVVRATLPLLAGMILLS